MTDERIPSMTNERSASMGDVQGTGGRVPVVVVSWLWVGVPFAWGVYELILKAKNLFGA